jgi:molybdopterin converting factor small subunit
MPVTVRLPAPLREKAGTAEVTIEDPVHDVASVWSAIARRFPTLARELADPIYNVAINDVILLHGVGPHPVKDDDVIEIIPTIAGG